ncbi:hypothetical protein [Pseudomonas delhiensis]|uniref:restriction endonuclease subunit S n=1 Tax=Pseudomonas delhiensis TaxID=366289 RepID=UPI003159C133
MSSELRRRLAQAGGTVPENWTVVSLETLLRDNKSIAVGVMYPGPDTPGGIPLIKVGDIKGGVVHQAPTYCISPETNQEYKRTQLEGDELLITLVGSPGECVIVQPHMKGWNPARAIAVLRLSNPSLRTYLKTVLESSASKHLIDAVLNTTVQKTLNLKDVRQLPIPLPHQATIEEISAVSEALTDRITLLRETNATLEAIAQALFKSWFVDFDPVRAKAEGRQPEGMDAATAALFPDSFEESELGLVPKGWSELPLKDLCSFQKGCSYKGDGLSESQGAYMFNLGCFNEPRTFAFEKVKRYVGGFKSKHQVEAGDLILANTDMTQQRNILGRPLLVPERMCPGFVSHHVFKVCLDRMYGEELKYYLFYSFQQTGFRERAVGYATGTTVLALPRDALEEHCVVLPPKVLMAEFADVCTSLLRAVHNNEERAKNLVQVRETLLPRLISGQLRLPDADALLEAAS